jgi:hypothetical protein
MSRINIKKGDNRNTRNSKKRENNQLKRKSKQCRLENNKLIQTKRGRFHSTTTKTFTFGKSIDLFVSHNLHLAHKGNKLIIKLNKDFSLFENPAKVLTTLVDLIVHAKTLKVNPKIIYDGHVSFGAIYLLDNLSWEIGKKRKWVLEKRNFPDEEASILSNIKSFTSSTYEDGNEFMINERVVINRSDPSANQQYKAKAKDITDMLQTAIREIFRNPEYVLPFEAHGAIKSTIGEAFDNIHLHSEITEYGTLCGFYNKMNKEITLLVYNFGRTIAETFTAQDVPTEMADDINQVLINHTKRNYINFTRSGDFTLENALTLLAIQEGISSRIQFDISRGHGIIDLIEHCLDLSSKSRLSIISGRTAIKIDKTYPLERKLILGRERRILALNKANDIFQKPDRDFVINTGVNFNGVIIEATIPLNDIKNGKAT